MSKKAKIGLIGVGKWGKNIKRTLKEMGVLGMTSDLNGKEDTKDYWDILNNVEIDAVCIATEPQYHYQIAEDAIVAGRDVFVEKPFTQNLEEASFLIRLANDFDKILMAGFLPLYHTSYHKLKSKISEIGKINYIQARRLEVGKKPEDILNRLAPHDISLVVDLIGEPEKAVVFGSENSVILRLVYKDNDVGAGIFLSLNHPSKERTFTVMGSKENLVFDELKDIPKKEPLLLELEHFVDCVKSRRQPLTSGSKILKIIKTVDECKKSFNKNSGEGITEWAVYPGTGTGSTGEGDSEILWN